MTKEQWEKQNKGKDLVLSQPEHTINKPSHLIKQVYDNSLTVTQKKVYNYLIRTLLDNPKDILNSNEIKLHNQDLEKFLKKKQYKSKEIEEDLKKLQKTIISIDDGEYRTKSVLISSYTMPRDLFDNNIDGTLTIRFDTKLTKTLHEIKRYAALSINELSVLQNVHSVTYYEIFKRQLNKYNTRGKLNLTEEQLREFLNIPEEQYRGRNGPDNFHKKVVKLPLEEIHLNTSIDVSYERVKLSPGKYQYNFIFSQYVELTLSQFVQLLKEKSHYYDTNFKYKGKRYGFEKVYKLESLPKGMKEHKENIEGWLLVNRDIQEKKDLGESQSYFNNRETLTRDESDEVYSALYDMFLKEKSHVFLYKFFILNDLDQEIESINNIPPEVFEKVNELVQVFTR
jgi:hypothetical protein